MPAPAEVTAALLRDFGQPVAAPALAVATTGYLRARDILEEEDGFQVQRARRVLLVAPGTLGAAGKDSDITYAGTPYVLHRRLPDAPPGQELWVVGGGV